MDWKRQLPGRDCTVVTVGDVARVKVITIKQKLQLTPSPVVADGSKQPLLYEKETVSPSPVVPAAIVEEKETSSSPPVIIAEDSMHPLVDGDETYPAIVEDSMQPLVDDIEVQANPAAFGECAMVADVPDEIFLGIKASIVNYFHLI
jgi:hypothetical protein